MNTILVTYDTRQDGERGNVYVPGSIKDVRERRKDNE